MNELGLSLVKVGDRRREDYGDMGALAESIRRYGLLHPIVVDADDNLVAGGRRLEAVRQLGWISVPVRRLGELSETEMREIELEENLQRKELTAIERSRNLVALVETVVETRAESAHVSRNGSRGPAPQPTSTRQIADEIGVPESTIRAAREHVAAVEEFPQLEPLPQAEALREHKRLMALAKDEFFPAPTPAFDAFFKAAKLLLQNAMPAAAAAEDLELEDRQRVVRTADVMTERIAELAAIARDTSLRIVEGGKHAAH